MISFNFVENKHEGILMILQIMGQKRNFKATDNKYQNCNAISFLNLLGIYLSQINCLLYSYLCI